MSQVKKLIGKNVYLGPVDKKHIPTLVKWMNDLEVVKFTCQISKMHTEETARKFLEEGIIKTDFYYFGIYTNKGILIGGTDFRDVDHLNRTALLGIAIGEKEYWNKGYGTEAISLLVTYGFNVLNLNNILLEVFSFNPRAIKCYKKVGFKVIGKRRKSRFFEGRYYDEIYMDLLAADFKK